MQMTRVERKDTAIVASIFALRMLGLLMILPVLGLALREMPGATPRLVGWMAGIYGLSQALFQIPLGFLSDCWGRKPIIIGGLLLLAVGSGIAGFSENIYGVIVGRTLQGVSAIGSVLLALLLDVTREGVHARAMAWVGGSIGGSFILAMGVGPVIGHYFGLRGIFLATAVLACLGALCVFSVRSVPRALKEHRVGYAWMGQIPLWRSYGAVLVLHAILVMVFLWLPFPVEHVMHLTEGGMWQLYVPVVGGSLCVVLPLLRKCDTLAKQVPLASSAFWGLGIALIGLSTVSSRGWFVFWLLGFFAAFQFLEASLPTQVARLAPPARKGSALGGYACFQFLGLFLGGSVGGWLLQTGVPHLLGICVFLALSMGFFIRGLLQRKGDNPCQQEG